MVAVVALVAALADAVATEVVVEASPEVALVAAASVDAVVTVADVEVDVVSPQEAAVDSETDGTELGRGSPRLTDRTLVVCQLELTQSSLVKEIDL